MVSLHCQNCQQRLQIDDDFDGLWLTCPKCLTNIMNPNRAPDARTRRVDVSRPDTDVRRDMTGTIVCLVVFGVLLAGGFVVFFSSGAGQLITASPEGTTLLVLLGGLIVMLGVGTVCLIIFGKGPGTKVLATALGSVGMALAGVLLVVLLICAGIANLINTCASCGNPSSKQGKTLKP